MFHGGQNTLIFRRDLGGGLAFLSKDKCASLADVAAHAGVGRATLHRHFTGRDALIFTLARCAVDELEEAVETASANAPSYTEGLSLAMEALLPLAHRQMFLAGEPVDDPELAAQTEASDQDLADTIEAVKAAGGLDPQIPTPWLSATYQSLINAGWELVEASEAPQTRSQFIWRISTEGATA